MISFTRPPEEKGWRIELIEVPSGQYHSVEGEQWWTGCEWTDSIVGGTFNPPVYIRLPHKTFNEDQWCDKCELPEEDCCCGAIHAVSAKPATNSYAPGDGSPAAYKVGGVILHKTQDIVCDAMGRHPPFDSAKGRAIRRGHYLCAAALALFLGLALYFLLK